MFYISVKIKDEWKLVTDSRGFVREFTKRKKAQNFIDGRLYIQKLSASIVTSVPDRCNTYKVEL